jgi:hypothetical protein
VDGVAVTLLDDEQLTAHVDSDAKALIEEARRRHRKRWFVIRIFVLIAVVVGGVSYSVVGRPGARARHTGAPSPTKTLSTAHDFVLPKAPNALAIAPNGDLLVLDSGRDQILQRLSSGKFRVLAGDGKRGFSGDGGPAVRAKINVGYQAGIAVAKSGTVYFADDGNGRVREVLPDGIIRTVAGGGTVSLGTRSLSALSASFGQIFSLFGLVIGPNRQLYIGSAKGVYRLSSDGILHWVVGSSVNPKDWGGVYSNPAIQSDFAPAVRLAFDGRGDLLAAGGGGWGLYEKTRTGKLRFVEVFRGNGFWGSLAEGTGGSVVMSYRDGIFRFSPSGMIKPIRLSATTDASPLNAALGKRNIFIGGGGVVVGPNGDIYVDTNTGNAFTSVSAILDLRPSGKASVLWKS